MTREQMIDIAVANLDEVAKSVQLLGGVVAFEAVSKLRGIIAALEATK